jgi:hypothetical protein
VYDGVVLEYMPGGEVKWRTPNAGKPTNTVERTREIFRDVLLGLDYRALLLLLLLSSSPSASFCFLLVVRLSSLACHR